MRRTLASYLILAATASAVAACHRSAPETEGAADAAAASTASTVVARFDGDAITAEDVDGRILALPASQRPKPGEDLDRWYADQVREMVVDRRLLAEARERGLRDEEAFGVARREAEKQVGLQLCLAELRPGAEEITEADLRTAFEEHSEELSAPERRLVYQIFLRRAPGALQRITAIRDRVLGGESFSRLAAELSESETRHRDGFVGWIIPGRLPAGFEDAVFGLEEGVPSEPVSTREGFHLFYVEQILPARRATYEEARPFLLQRLKAERREAALADLDKEVQPPPGSLVLDRDGFAAVVEAGDPGAAVLRLGDEEWTLEDVQGRVRAFLARESKVAGAPTLELAWQILDQARRREELHQLCRTEDHIPADALAKRLETWERRALVDAERSRRLVDLAMRDEARLRLYYDSNIGDFSTAPTWTLRRLRAPLGDRAVASMERLEAAAAAPGTDLVSLQAELGGEIEELEPRGLGEIARLQPKLPRLVASLAPGQLSAPYRTEAGLEMVEVVARAEAEPIPFEEVRERVAQRYVAQYTAELYDDLRQEVLDETDLEIDPDALAALREAGLPQPDVTVDQLETLLDRL